MMRKKLSLTKKINLLSCLLVFLAVCVACFAFYDQKVPHVSLFHFDPEAVESINLQKAGGSDITITDREEINEAVRLLNNFKYYNGQREVPPIGWKYSITLTIDRKEFSIIFGLDHLYFRKPDQSIAAYFGARDYFRPLVDLLNGKRDTLIG